MNFAPSSRITPWVLRLIAANAVVLLLMRTIFISPELASALAFSPADALREPWTFFTYMFVHAGLLHLLGNMFMLFVFGTAVENRMGGRAFIFYYLLCGVGGAAFSLDDTAELTRLLERMASDPTWRAGLAARAKERSRAFSWRLTAEKTLAEAYLPAIELARRR